MSPKIDMKMKVQIVNCQMMHQKAFIFHVSNDVTLKYMITYINGSNFVK